MVIFHSYANIYQRVCWSLRICTLALAIDVCLQDGQVPQGQGSLSSGTAGSPREAARTSQRGPMAQQFLLSLKWRNLEKSLEKTVKSCSGPNARYLGCSRSGRPGRPGKIHSFPWRMKLHCVTDGLPSWVSPREGHLIALLACHCIPAPWGP